MGGGADEDTGVVNLTTGNNNGRATLQTINPVDVSTAASFTMSWDISSGTDLVKSGSAPGIWHGGFFFGVTSQNVSKYGDAGYAFGVDLANWNVYEKGATNTTHALSGSAPTQGSMEDGFTLSLTLRSDESWEVSTTGLSNTATYTGVLDGTRASFDDLAPTLVAHTFIGGGGSSYTVDSATLSAAGVPEPSTTALMGLGGLALILRRRR